MQLQKGGRFADEIFNCANPLKWHIHSLSLSLPSSAVEIFAAFAAYIGFISMGDIVINIAYFAFAASSWAFTSSRHSDNCGYLLSSDLLSQHGVIAVTSMPQNGGRRDGALMFHLRTLRGSLYR